MKSWKKVYNEMDPSEQKMVHKLTGLAIFLAVSLILMGGYHLIECVNM